MISFANAFFNDVFASRCFFTDSSGAGLGGHDSTELRVKLDQLREKMQLKIEELDDDLREARDERDEAQAALNAAKVGTGRLL